MMQQQFLSFTDRLNSRSEGWLELVGRLKTGQTLLQTQEEMNLLMQRIVQQFPKAHQGDNKITSFLCGALRTAQILGFRRCFRR